MSQLNQAIAMWAAEKDRLTAQLDAKNAEIARLNAQLDVVKNRIGEIPAEVPESDADKLRTLATMLDVADAAAGVTDHEMQDDLRRIADVVEAGPSGEIEHLTAKYDRALVEINLLEERLRDERIARAEARAWGMNQSALAHGYTRHNGEQIPDTAPPWEVSS